MYFYGLKQQIMILSEDEILKIYPILDRKTPSRDVSGKYTIVPTIDIIRDVKQTGWSPVNVEIRGEGKSDFCKHAVTFQKDVDILVSNKDIINPTMTVVNSYDGLSTVRFYAGFYRRISNTFFTIPIKTGDDVYIPYMKVSHTKYNFDLLDQYIQEITNAVMESVKQVLNFTQIQLREEEYERFVKIAFSLRRDKEPTVDILNVLLEPMRGEDDGDNAWVIMNSVQEKIIKGFSVYNEVTKKEKKYRAINSFERILPYNLEMYLSMLDICTIKV